MAVSYLQHKWSTHIFNTKEGLICFNSSTNSEGCVYPEHVEGFPDARGFQVRYYTLPEDTQLPEHSERSPLGKSDQCKLPQSAPVHALQSLK